MYPIKEVSSYVREQVYYPPYLIPDVLPDGGTLLVYGKAGIRKSWLLLDMGFSLATGSQWLGWDCQQVPVMLVNFELQPYEMHKRLVHVDSLYNVEENFMHVWSCGYMALEKRDQFDLFKEQVMQYSPKVIILDCMRYCFSGDENSSVEFLPWMYNFREIQMESGVAVVAAHHSNKNETPSARGTTALDGFFYTMIHLLKQPSGGNQLRFDKNRDARFDLFNVNTKFENYEWTVRGTNPNIRTEE